MGILPGILAGAAFVYFMVPKGFYFPDMVKIWLLTMAVNIFTVMFSVRKPAKIAASAAPIEAAKMNDFCDNVTGKLRRERKLTPFGLAKISFDSNKKKSAMTAVSLGIGGVFFIMGTTLLVSYNQEEYSRQREYFLGDYMLEISDNAVQTAEHGMADIQLTKPFSKELESEIEALDGVKKIFRRESFALTYEYNNYQANDAVRPFDREEAAILEQYRQEGEVFDYDRMVRNKEIIIYHNSVAKEIFGWQFEIGSTVKFRWYDGSSYREDYFTVGGCVEGIHKDQDEDARLIALNIGWFFMPEDLLKNMLPDGYDFCDELIISVEDYKTDTIVKEFIENLAVENPYLSTEAFTDYLKENEINYASWNYVVWGLSAFIIGFALINLINTIVSNIVARKKEFAMLCSIGMSGSQLRKMIIGEGVILAVKNIVITICLGIPAGYILIWAMREWAAPYLHWHFPAWYLLGYVVLVVAAPVIISGVIINILNRKSLVERLREGE